MMKRILALVLAMVMCLSLAACGEKTEDTADTSASAAIDYAKAFAKHDANDVVMTINGEDVTWSEFYYMLSSAVGQLTYYLGDMDWDEKILEDYDHTLNKYSMQLTMESIKQFHALSKQAKEAGIELTDADKQQLQATSDNFKLQNCGEGATDEEFEAYLMENFYLTGEVYDFINTSSLLYEKLFAEYIGTTGEKLTDEDINEYIESMPYITAKHILIKTVDANGAALSQEQQDAAKAKAEDILSRLQGITKQKELAETFDRLMKEYTEDEGTSVFTEGYTFTTGEMYPVFEEAAFALEEYQISGLVKSEAGYHILLRLPTTRDSMVDIDYQNNAVYTITNYAATSKYGELIASWMEAADVQWADGFEGVSAQEIFE